MNENQNIVEKIIHDLNIITRHIPENLIPVSDAKLILQDNISERLNYVENLNEALCQYLNLNYDNIKNNNINILDLLEESRCIVQEKDINMKISELKNFTFYNGRGCEFTRGRSILIPLIEYYYHKKENKDTLYMHSYEPLKYKIYNINNRFHIMTGKGCCNHRLYGISQSFGILKDSLFNIRELDTINIQLKNKQTYNFIVNNLLKNLSINRFQITSFYDNEIVMNLSGTVIHFLLNDIGKNINQGLLKNFVENIDFWEKLVNKTNVKTIIITTHHYDNELLEIKFFGKKEKILIIENNTINLLYESSKIMVNKVRLLSFWIHYYIFNYYVSGDKIYLNNIDLQSEKKYYINQFFQLLRGI